MTAPAHLEALAAAIVADEPDSLDVFEALKPVLSREDFKRLGAMLDYCPIHVCDIQICLDDGIHGNEVF